MIHIPARDIEDNGYCSSGHPGAAAWHSPGSAVHPCEGIRQRGSYHGQLLLSVYATWFFHILAFRAVYEGEGLVYSLKVLGFRLWHNRGKGSCQDLEDGLETILEMKNSPCMRNCSRMREHYRKSQEEQAHGGQSVGEQTHGGQSVGEQTHGGQSGGEQTRGGRSVEEQAHGSQLPWGTGRRNRTPTGRIAGKRRRWDRGLSLTKKGARYHGGK